MVLHRGLGFTVNNLTACLLHLWKGTLSPYFEEYAGECDMCNTVLTRIECTFLTTKQANLVGVFIMRIKLAL